MGEANDRWCRRRNIPARKFRILLNVTHSPAVWRLVANDSIRLA